MELKIQISVKKIISLFSDFSSNLYLKLHSFFFISYFEIIISLPAGNPHVHFCVDIDVARTWGSLYSTRDPVTLRVRNARVTIPRTWKREKERERVRKWRMEGCRGQGATDVLPHDAHGVAVPLLVSRRLVVFVRVASRWQTEWPAFSFVSFHEDLIGKRQVCIHMYMMYFSLFDYILPVPNL